jgi:2-polyprenyl-3-methyl-5-hydroxy-6-metoxy-1,4-benzoquinol methylase
MNEQSISEKYINALKKYFNMTEDEVIEIGSMPDNIVFDPLFTPKVTEDDNAIKKIYSESPYFCFRNVLYYRDREENAFSPFWKIIVNKPGSVLDYGSGAGVFIEVLLRKGITDITYTDIPGKTFEFAKWFFGDKIKYENDPDNIQGYYDYITCNSVLEHIPDPIRIVKMFGEHLKPGGKIIASMATDIHGQHLKKSIDKYSEVMTLITDINKKSEDYYNLQINGSAWTTKDPHYQELLKEALGWALKDMTDKPKFILDLGCGDGWSTEYLRKQLPAPDINIVGGDIDENKLKAAKERGVNVEYQDIHNICGKWDIIFCSHTLEHSYDAKKAIKSIVNALLPNGKLYLIIPIEEQDPRSYNPSHTQWFNSPTMIKAELLSYPEVQILYEEKKTRDTLEYWVIIRKSK